MYKLRRKQGGFTMLELVVVVLVVAILAALIIPNFASAPAKNRDAQRKKDLLTIKTALETYYSEDNTYPGATTWKTDLTDGTTPFLTKIPTDPKTHQDYTYTPIPTSCTTGSCTSYTLSAQLENTKDPEAGVGGVYELKSAN